MEHEVFVPVPVERLREVLADPVRVAQAVPGLQQDSGAEPVTGRLKVRVDGHTITYRGAVRITVREDGSYAAEGDATEARGTGSVRLTLTLTVAEAENGSVLTFAGEVSGDGRIAEFPADAVTSAGARLLDRFGGQLGTVAGEAPDATAGQDGGPEGADVAEAEAVEEALAPEEFEGRAADDVEGAPDPHEAPETETEDTEGEAVAEGDREGAGSVFDDEVPPSALDPRAQDDDESAGGAGADEPVAEAAHARRTMIGRSAEEVDHAPPRGRYMPVPAAQGVAQSSTLRWAAPAAVLVVASAVVLGRMLRRRR